MCPEFEDDLHEPSPHVMLSEILASGEFVVTAEIGPPAGTHLEKLVATAGTLAPVVHAANITDNQAATVKMSPLACATFMREAGLETILQVTGRDRNLLALQSDLLGAWAVGVRTVLALTGDPLRIGRYDSLATQVRDVDSLGLSRLIASMNAGVMGADESLDPPTRFLIAGAANPLVDSLERLEAKLDAGVRLLQTNIVYDVDRFAQWLSPLVEAGLAQRASLLVGVCPPRNAGMLRHLHDNIPGIEVDDATFARMHGLDGARARAEGIGIAADVVRGVRDLPGVSGVHIMAPGWEAEAVPEVVDAAGLLSSSTV